MFLLPVQTMTEKKLRKQLEADLGLDLLPRKDFIRTVVSIWSLWHLEALLNCVRSRVICWDVGLAVCL